MIVMVMCSLYEQVQEMGDFFEILLWLNENKILSILFDLDGDVVGLELREDKRKKFSFFNETKLQWNILYFS